MSTLPSDDPRSRIREWQYLNGADFASMDRERTVVVLSCSPLEVHGPHLPVSADYQEAEGISRRAMEMLLERHDDIDFVCMPPVYVAADVVPQPGSVMFRSSTIVRVLTDLGRSLARQGFRHIWVGSFHGGPRHFVAIERAADAVNRRHGAAMVSMFSLLLNRLTGGRSDLSQILGHLDGFDPADLVGDTHGGLVETSILLHLLGPHVHSRYRDLERMTVNIKLERQGLPPLRSEGRPGIAELIRGFRHKIKYFETETYSGAPSGATPELGAQFLDVLAGHVADALTELWTGELAPEECRSPLWKVRWLFASETLGWLFERIMGHRNQVF